tara:strand:+ start:611 stop:1213 length:603 start_codon:yes stop_codon:yes gene_type:complete
MGVISNGTTILDAGAIDSGVATGAMTLLSTSTASSSATIDITSGIDSTYKEYQFHFTNIHPATNNADFTFQADTGTNTNYNQTMTTTSWRGYHSENDSDAAIGYDPGRDQAQGTAFQILAHEIGNANDENVAMILTLFNPSSSVFVKHFIATNNINHNTGLSENKYVAGYFNTTTALTRVRFKMSSGNIDAGTIKMYGIK